MSFHNFLKRGAFALAAVALATPAMASVSSAAGPSSVTAPASPTNVVAVSGNRALAVTWSESSTNVVSYLATATSAGKPTVKCTSHVTNCRIVSLLNGVVYHVSVVASNAGGKSAPSADITQIVGIPSAPLSVHAFADKASATITWAPPIASGVAAVTSYIATAVNGTNVFSCSTSGTLLAPPARTCVIPGLTSGTKYSVSVIAMNAYGTGPASKATTVTPS